MKTTLMFVSLLVGTAVPTCNTNAALDTNRIATITGLPGTWNAAEGVFKVSAPRNDVPVKVDEWKMPPFMGLTSWAAFQAGRKAEAMVMGDLVLFEDEVNPVMSAAPLMEAFAAKAQEKDGMVKFVFGRVTRMECGCEIGKEMGVNTWASFGGTDDNAVVDGDIACQENELQTVLKSLRASSIHIVAIHHHMIGESPRYVFLHYWGRGKAAELAQAVNLARGEKTKAAALARPATAEAINFDSAEVGKAPPGWTLTKTGQGQPKWNVERDTSAPSKPNVLKQSGEAAYPVAFKDGTNLQDGFVEVKFKTLSGEEDQAGGVVWRAKDADNYYIARANALEDNVRIYHFVNGRRTQFKGVNIKVAPNQWHTLRVEFAANTFKVIFNGKHLFDAQDATFKEAGKVGVWTKADSITLFDDFSHGAK